LIQVYTGNGKGKTTAGIGLALRAAGAGLKVFICQFAKPGDSSELKLLKKIKNIKVECFGSKGFIKRSPCSEDIHLAKKGLSKIYKIIQEKSYDVLILDEINVALDIGLLELKDVIHMIKNTPPEIELILTGRNAPKQILKIADLVSEIKDRKHYYKKGVKARRGIEF